MLKKEGIVNKKELVELQKGLKSAFKTIKEELEDHLSAININTEEISKQEGNFYMIDEKIEKLNQKIDNLTVVMNNIKKRLPEQEGFFPTLSKQEQRVFALLYTIENTPLSYLDISTQLRIPELSTKKLIENLVGKGIPILQKKIDDKFFFTLEPKFKELQMKKNVVNIDLKE